MPGPPQTDPDHVLRVAGVTGARELARAFDDLVALERLREGFEHQGERISVGSLQKGIHRSDRQVRTAALTLTTSFNIPTAT